MDSVASLTLDGLLGLGGVFAFVLFVATVIQMIQEQTIALFYDNIAAAAPYKWTQKIWAGALGVLAAFFFEINIIKMGAEHLEFNGLPATPQSLALAFALSGLVLGMGAQYLHVKWFKK